MLWLLAGILIQCRQGSNNLKNISPDYILQAENLLYQFESDSAGASKKYSNSVLSISGTIKTMDTLANPFQVIFGTPGKTSSIIFLMDPSHEAEYKKLREGDPTSIKGRFVKAEPDPFSGTDLTLEKAVLDE